MSSDDLRSHKIQRLELAIQSAPNSEPARAVWSQIAHDLGGVVATFGLELYGLTAVAGDLAKVEANRDLAEELQDIQQNLAESNAELTALIQLLRELAAGEPSCS